MGNSSSSSTQPPSPDNVNQNASPISTESGGKGMSKDEMQKLAVSAMSGVPSECPMHGDSKPTGGCPVQHDAKGGTTDIDPLNMVRKLKFRARLFKTNKVGCQKDIKITAIFCQKSYKEHL